MHSLLRFLVFASLAVSCSAESTSSPSPTPAQPPNATSTATPDFSLCPVDPGTCAIAQRLIDGIAAGDVDGLVRMGSPIEATCPFPRPQGLGGPYPLCEDASFNGEIRTGYVWSSGSHGGLADEVRFRKDLTELATSHPPLRSIGCAIKPGLTNVCDGDFILVFGPKSFGTNLLVVSEVAVRRSDPVAKDGILGVLPVFVLPTCALKSDDFRCERLTGGNGDFPDYRYWGTGREGTAGPHTGRFFKWAP